MEYPFKDLLPLDEVLEREGYYKDWTHLDPEVFYSLTQISEYIKTKGYGVDVRLLIAQLAEHFGLKSTQIIDLANLLQQKFENLEGVTQSFTTNINSLVEQMEADKNAVIANVTVDSEVILARGGNTTLGERLDDTDVQLSHKVEQEEFNLLKPHVNVKDFGAVGDGMTDDYVAIQTAIFEAYKTKRSVYLPNGRYTISKPLVVISEKLVNSYVPEYRMAMIGESKRATAIVCRPNFKPLVTYDDEDTYSTLSTKAALLVVNDSWLNNIDVLDENTFKIGSGPTNHVQLADFTLHGDFYADYGILWPGGDANSSYKRLRVINVRKSAYRAITYFYLNVLEQLRADNGKKHFDFGDCYTTSLSFINCYSQAPTEYAWLFDQGEYNMIMNSACDHAKGTVIDFGRSTCTAIGFGSESVEAKTMFRAGYISNVSIIGATTWGNRTDPDASHIVVTSNGIMNFHGGLVGKNTQDTILPGRMVEKSFGSKVHFELTELGEYVKGPKIVNSGSYSVELNTGLTGSMVVSTNDSVYAGVDFYFLGGSSAVAPNAVIATIPDGLRPRRNTVIPIYETKSAGVFETGKHLMLKTNGDLVVPSNGTLSASSQGYTGNIVYAKRPVVV